MRTRILVALALLLTACGGGGGGGGSTPTPSPPTLALTGVTVAGTTDTVAAVTVNGVADADGSEDTAWTASLAMDGSQLPVYSANYAATITVTATDTEALTRIATIDLEVGP
jgi:hypothetical protein